MNHFRTGICLLHIVSNCYRIKFALRFIPTQNTGRVFPSHSTASFNLCPHNLSAITSTIRTLGNKIINSAFTIFVTWVPILDSGIFNLSVLFDYDFNAYRGKYEEDGNFEFVLPCEGSVRVPYVMSLVNNGPHPELGKRVLDFILSDKGQAIWTNAYLQPARPVELPADVAAKFLPASDYERAVAVDYAKMEKAQAGFGERYLSEVK